MEGFDAVYLRGPQRRSFGGVLGGVYDLSGLPVCVWRSSRCLHLGPTRFPTARPRTASSSSSHCWAFCTAWSVVLGRLWTPWCTLAGRLGGVPGSGERSDGGFHSGDVGRRTPMSQVLRKSLSSRVILGGERCSGVSFHSIAVCSDSGRLTAGVTAGFLVWGGSLASLLAQRLKQFLSDNWISKIGTLGCSSQLLIFFSAKSSF